MTTSPTPNGTTGSAQPAQDIDCSRCELSELRFLVGMRVVGDLGHLLGRGDVLASVVEHVAATFARGVADGGHPDGWDGFWLDYWLSVTADTNPEAADPDQERRRVWLVHAARLRGEPDVASPRAAGGAT